VVCDLLIVDVPGISYGLKAPQLQRLRGQVRQRGKIPKSADVFMDLLCHSRGKHPGVGPWIRHQLFFIQLLDHLQGLVGTDLEHFGAVVLKLRQVV